MFYTGLDLGKLRDFTAIAVVEREDRQSVGPAWLATTEAPFELRVRYLERIPLGTPYTRVVERVAGLTRHPVLNGNTHLTVDATGLGEPVVDFFRAAKLGCRAMTAVTITSGERARQAPPGLGVGEHWHVPKSDLLSVVQVLLERGELKIGNRIREAETLKRELLGMRSAGFAESGNEHDDLVMAVALGCWQAMRTKAGLGTKRLAGI